MSREHQRETDELTERIGKLQSDLTTIRDHSRERIDGLEQELKVLEANAAETIKSLTRDLRYLLYMNQASR